MDGISASVSGVQAAGQSMAVAASNVSNANSANYRAKRMDLEDTYEGGVRPEAMQESQETPELNGSNVELASEAVDQKADKITYGANLQFLAAASAMLGSAMDMKA